MYNSYQNFYRNQQMNVLPPQQVIQVNGKSSVDTIQMTPNSSILLLDNTAPIVWLCVSDGVGRVTATPYDISEHKDDPKSQPADLEGRLASVELAISKLEGKLNAYESNAEKSKSK